jgi:hypothetical protein
MCIEHALKGKGGEGGKEREGRRRRRAEKILWEAAILVVTC